MNLFDPISTVLKHLGSTLLHDTEHTAQKLDSDDEEALHDFRVSVRRLRSFLKSYEDYIKNAKKHRQRLSAIMDLTNSGRDFEVHLAWLNSKQNKASDLEQDGILYLLENLSSKEHVDLKRVKKEFEEAAKKMTKVFLQDEGDVQTKAKKDKTDKNKTFASVTANVLQSYSQEFRSLLGKIKSLDDEVIHEARIAGKRMRYTLELLELEEAKALIKTLKKFQDTTGDLHDLQVLEPKLQTFLFAETVLWSQAFRDGSKTLSHEELGQLPELQRSYGLAAVQRNLEHEKTSLYTSLETNWLGATSESFFEDLQALIQQLAGEAKQTPTKKKRQTTRKRTTKPKTTSVRKKSSRAST
jgi:CHAD domain-containing protein